MSTSRTPTRRVRVRRHTTGGAGGEDDVGGRATLAVEEPLEIRMDGHVLAITMRTPGHDFDLALGFAITDGGVDPSDIGAMSYCGVDAGEQVGSHAAADLSGPYAGDFNVVNVATRAGDGPAVQRRRATAVTSACGICGTDVMADLVHRAGSVADDAVRVPRDVVAAVPDLVRRGQAGFDATGATHAAAAVGADGELLVLREDIGRHNAVDKVVGALASRQQLPAGGSVLFTSGRVAFEIVAKALVAGFPVIVSVSAPTSLAVETADAAGLTLVGFARHGTFTVYSHPDRIS